MQEDNNLNTYNFVPDVFIVKCQKLGRAQKYGLAFPYNIQLIERIKKFSREEREYKNNIWVLKTYTLYNLIKIYKGSNKIRFEFIGDVNAKEIFKRDVEKILIEEHEKQLKIEKLERNKKEWLAFKADLDINYEKYSEVVHKNLKEGVRLYNHQIVGTIYANKIKKCLLALDMGTGKSLISISLCEMNQYKKVFVIVPNSLKHNFYQEIQKFTNSKAHIIGWKKNKYTIEESRYIITNFEFFNTAYKEKKKKNENEEQSNFDKDKFNKKWKKLNINNLNILIVDECQKISNTSTNMYHNITKTFNDDIFENKNKIALYMSGSPAKNYAGEYYAVLHEINDLDFPTKTKFLTYFCGMKYDYELGYNVIDWNDTKYEELFNKISPYVYRKKLRDCVNLPSEQHNKIILEFDDKELKEYMEIEKGFNNETLNIENQMTIMLRLRQYLSNIKLKYVYELIDSILETDQKIIIFDEFKLSLQTIKQKYGDICCLHTGDQTPEKRAEMVNDFQNSNGTSKIFLSTFAVGNYGLTLTISHILFMLTIPYSLSVFRQAVARIIRIGQQSNVMIYPFIFNNSIDEYIFTRLEQKSIEVDTVLDGKVNNNTVNESVMNDVINDIKNKYKNKRNY